MAELLALYNDCFNVINEKGRSYSSLFLEENIPGIFFSLSILTLWKSEEEFSVEEIKKGGSETFMQTVILKV